MICQWTEQNVNILWQFNIPADPAEPMVFRKEFKLYV